MDEDDETKEEDPVVREIEVVLADWGDPTDDAPRPGLALLQYRIRGASAGPSPSTPRGSRCGTKARGGRPGDEERPARRRARARAA